MKLNNTAGGRAPESPLEPEAARVSAERLEAADLRLAQMRYRRLFETARNGLLLVDASTQKIIDANPVLAEWLGYPRQGLLGKELWEVGLLKDRPASQEIFRALSEKTHHGHPDLVLETKTGQRRPIQWESHSYDEEGRMVVQFSLYDMTEGKRAQARLRESEHKYHVLWENLPQRVFLKDCASVYVACNATYARDLATDPAALVGKTDFDFFPRELAERYRADDQRVMESGLRTKLEEPYLMGDKQRWIHTIKTPVHDEAGGCTGLLCVFWDVTERRQTEEENQRLVTAIEQASDSIVITDFSGTIRYVNPAFERITGYSKLEALGQHTRLLKSGQQPPEFYRQMWEVLSRGEVWSGHFTNKRKNGTFFEEYATISPVRDATGAIVNYVAVKHDITREAHLEALLRQSQKMEAIGQLCGGVAHDFNNILALIMMQSELTGMVQNLPQEAREGLLQIGAAAERAANLTRQLLLFSRKQVMQPRPLDLNQVVTSLARMLQRIIGEDVRLEINLHPRPQYTRADAGMLDQVLMNLVVNARDAMAEGGKLFIETNERLFTREEAALIPDARPGPYVGLRVTDSGCGIAPENLSRIFEPFFTTKPPGKGTGLGLATVFGIVKQHQGWLVVESELGHGTAFQIFLPASQEAYQSPDAAALMADLRGGTETILLVEDELAVRALTRATLERAGYRVLEASNGVEALRIWEQHQKAIRLLLTDMVMPEGVSGRELAARLQVRNPGLRVIFTSGYSADIAGRELSLEEGQNFIQKPCPPRQLLETIRRWLDA